MSLHCLLLFFVGADGRMWDDRVKFIHFFKYLEGPKGCYMKALQMAQCQ